MNREHWKEMLPIITAFVAGEEVQRKHRGEWTDFDSFDFTANPENYRIKPKPREMWVCIEDGSAWDYREQAADACKRFHGATPMKVREIIDP